MLRTFTLFAVSLLAAGLAAAQNNMPLIDENATAKISDHVWAIEGWPNIAIVIGNRSTLVVDTGLGPRNGATIMKVVKKLSTNQKLYLTTTHFHVEHTAGEAAFPAETILIRPAAQQEEVERSVDGMIARFSTMSAQNKELLAGVKLHSPDVVFGGSELKLDLGGVTARLLWLGTGHTKGDELIFVDPDSTLIPGDIVQDKHVPRVNRGEGSPKSWLAILDRVEAMKPRHIIPDHGELGDGSLIGKERAFIADLQARALALKRQGVPVGDAGKQLTAEFQAKYRDWQSMDLVVAFVERVYEEN
jgi:glyoxylase-like metal-dependent hydrolase (beta-lactamase superfamily II)